MSGQALIQGRGRKPKPANLKILSGSRRVKTEKKQSNEIDENLEPPDCLNKQAAEIWKEVVPYLANHGLITATDLHNVEVFCQSLAMWRETVQDINKHGVMIKNKMTGKYYKNPAITIMNTTTRTIATFGSLLGMDPASRQKLIQPKPDTNPFYCLQD